MYFKFVFEIVTRIGPMKKYLIVFICVGGDKVDQLLLRGSEK